MTNKEAIEVLNGLQELYRLDYTKEAIGLAITALRAQADKERRYRILEEDVLGPFRVQRVKDGLVVANFLPTREAAQAIADIYEGMES